MQCGTGPELSGFKVLPKDASSGLMSVWRARVEAAEGRVASSPTLRTVVTAFSNICTDRWAGKHGWGGRCPEDGAERSAAGKHRVVSTFLGKNTDKPQKAERSGLEKIIHEG